MEEHINENKKRRPLKNRILKIVVLITVASLVVTSLFGIISMLVIDREAEQALTKQSKENLVKTIEMKTELANLKLEKYKEITAKFAYYVEDILANEKEMKRFDLTSPDTYDTGDLVYSFALADKSFRWDDLKDQAEYFANIVHRIYPSVSANRNVIQTTYFGFDNGLLLSYDNASEFFPPQLMYYNYLQKDWYQLGKKVDVPTFTGAYVDNFERGLTITCVCPIRDREGVSIGVLGMDMGINELYDFILDIDLGDDVSAYIINKEGKIISRNNDISEEEMNRRAGRILDTDKQRMLNYPDGIVFRDNNYYAFSTIESVGWRLCLRVPQSHVLELANTMDRSIVSSILIFIFFFFIIMLTVIVIVFEFSKKITQPIIDLKKDIGEISAGDLEHRAKIYENDEIGDLAEQFNEMTVSLKLHIDSVTEMTVEKERMGAELGVAAQIQKNMMPTDFPERKDISLYATMDPAKEVGGDFYDFFMIDDDHMGLIMADVSGKGVPAAMFMIVAKTLMKMRTSMMCAPSEMMWDVNNTLCADNMADMFVTAWFGILTVSTGEITYVNAGHEYPAVRHKNGNYELIVTENMPPLAAMENVEFKDESIKLRAGDVLFLYTDGITDAKSPDGKRFGTERMLEILNKNSEENDICSVLGAVKRRIDVFMDSADQYDDITMMGLIWRGK